MGLCFILRLNVVDVNRARDIVRLTPAGLQCRENTIDALMTRALRGYCIL